MRIRPDGGFLPVPRALFKADHELHPMKRGECACTLTALLDLAAMAKYQAEDGLDVGQVRVSERFLANRWRWSKNRVRAFLDEMKDGGILERDPHKSIVTLTTYSKDFAFPTRDPDQELN